jgi:hypothetical protein
MIVDCTQQLTAIPKECRFQMAIQKQGKGINYETRKSPSFFDLFFPDNAISEFPCVTIRWEAANSAKT